MYWWVCLLDTLDKITVFYYLSTLISFYFINLRFNMNDNRNNEIWQLFDKTGVQTLLLSLSAYTE